MYELLKRGIEVSNNGDFVGEKREDADEYRWVRYEQVLNATTAQISLLI